MSTPKGTLPPTAMAKLVARGYKQMVWNGVIVEKYHSLLKPVDDYYKDSSRAALRVRFGEYVDDPSGQVYLCIGQCMILLRYIRSVRELEILRRVLTRMIGNLE